MGLNYDELLNGSYAWEGAPPASQQDVSELKAWNPELPRNLVNLLLRSDGGTATMKDGTRIHIWPAKKLMTHAHPPGLVAFADDGGARIFTMDSREGFPYPVLAGSQHVSKCFGSFFDLRPR